MLDQRFRWPLLMGFLLVNPLFIRYSCIVHVQSANYIQRRQKTKLHDVKK